MILLQLPHPIGVVQNHVILQIFDTVNIDK